MKYLFWALPVFLIACNQSIKTANQEEPDPLPSWNEGSAKQEIIRFVQESTDAENPSFIPVEDRIAVFDNDGTLWSEKPVYFQFFFAMDRIREMAHDRPEWSETQPFKAVLENDMKTVMESGVEGLLTLTLASHSGMTTQEFENIVRNWINKATHPETGKLYKDMVYQPMLELLDYFRENHFKTYIVSGGGIDFMRPWTEEVYGIPGCQVIGSSGKYEFMEKNDGQTQIVKMPEIDFINDKEAKPIGIHKQIGKRPVAAFGNSDGDLAMLKWTATGKGKKLMVYIHHTDEAREWAYDRDSHIGKLDKGLDVAGANNWLVVDMKDDWNSIYPPN